MTKILIGTRARATTIRTTTDILQKTGRQLDQQLFPAAALRICDHQLHSSGIIPRIYRAPGDSGAIRIYEHDWFCVSQAVRCYPQATAIFPPGNDASSPPTLLHRVVSGTEACHCDVWVEGNSIGNSSIQFGGLVSIGHDILAVVRRVFVRMAPHDSSNTEGSAGKLKSARFSNKEKERFRESFGLEALNIAENYKASDAKKLHDLVEVKRPELESDRLKTRINELESLPPSSSNPPDGKIPITRAMVGPQNINFGSHADHAFLAETAFHALTISTKTSVDYLSVQYIAEVFLGDLLESYPYRQDRTGEEPNSIILVVTRKTTGERKVVLIAQAE
mmetsp:Transcript_1749/g.4193  ORF Transcript_1749/g.4193 Transcript_1749/m.4193 type:complete len:335 (-) Transcript_1749:802-1806(-)